MDEELRGNINGEDEPRYTHSRFSLGAAITGHLADMPYAKAMTLSNAIKELVFTAVERIADDGQWDIELNTYQQKPFAFKWEENLDDEKETFWDGYYPIDITIEPDDVVHSVSNIIATFRSSDHAHIFRKILSDTITWHAAISVVEARVREALAKLEATPPTLPEPAAPAP
jgi:hypothetical protein